MRKCAQIIGNGQTKMTFCQVGKVVNKFFVRGILARTSVNYKIFFLSFITICQLVGFQPCLPLTTEACRGAGILFPSAESKSPVNDFMLKLIQMPKRIMSAGTEGD